VSSATQRGPVRVEITVPVHDEEQVLRASVTRLHAYLTDTFPTDWVWSIAIVDNASTDGTLEIAHALATELDGVRVLRLEEKGRGRALRASWSSSDADVVGYVDVDLSTGLTGLLPLVAPLVSGHSDVAVGSRLSSGAAVARGPKRGFAVPLDAWFRGPLVARFRETVLAPDARTRGVLARPAVERLLEQHLARTWDWHHELWALLWLETWYREVLEGARAATPARSGPATGA